MGLLEFALAVGADGIIHLGAIVGIASYREDFLLVAENAFYLVSEAVRLM